MKNLNKIIFVTIMIISQMLLAQRVVGVGGGLNEMKIVFIHEHLVQILQPCLQNPEKCNLNNDEQAMLKLVATHHAEEIKQSQISFYAEKSPEQFRSEPLVGASVKINSNALYFTDNNLRPFSDLLILILKVRFYHLNITGDQSDLFNKLSVISEEPNKFSFDSFSLYNFEYRNPFNQNEVTTNLFLEDKSKTVDITLLVLNSLAQYTQKTQTKADFSFNLLNTQQYNKNNFKHSVMWGSLNSSQLLQSKTLIIEFDSDTNDLFLEDSILVKIK